MRWKFYKITIENSIEKKKKIKNDKDVAKSSTDKLPTGNSLSSSSVQKLTTTLIMRWSNKLHDIENKQKSVRIWAIA